MFTIFVAFCSKNWSEEAEEVNLCLFSSGKLSGVIISCSINAAYLTVSKYVGGMEATVIQERVVHRAEKKT